MGVIIEAEGLSKRYYVTRSRGRNEWITAGFARGIARVARKIAMPWKKLGSTTTSEVRGCSPTSASRCRRAR